MCFFLQAEDGIRDLVRSRGLGDVYKRQVESMRNIALSTTVTLLVPADERDKANGLVGSVQGLSLIHI